MGLSSDWLHLQGATESWCSMPFNLMCPKNSSCSARYCSQESRDGIVSLGGGSAVGTAKAVCARLMDGGGFDRIPVVAIPTTYAGSEMTPVYGVTLDGRKNTKVDVRVLPTVVIYDPI